VAAVGGCGQLQRVGGPESSEELGLLKFENHPLAGHTVPAGAPRAHKVRGVSIYGSFGIDGRWASKHLGKKSRSSRQSYLIFLHGLAEAREFGSLKGEEGETTCVGIQEQAGLPTTHPSRF